MGAGDFPAGAGGAGFDPTSATSSTSGLGPMGLLYDPVGHDLVLDEDGNYVAIHWVDSEVLTQLGIRKGAILSVPDAGGTLADLPIDTADNMTADANRRVALALNYLIAAGDVTVNSVTAWADPSYRAHVNISYTNNRLPNPTVQTLTFGGS